MSSAQKVLSLPSRDAANGAADRRVDDGDVLPIGQLKVKAMHTPGHGGLYCYACGGDVEDDANIEVLITGDRCSSMLKHRQVRRRDGANV